MESFLILHASPKSLHPSGNTWPCNSGNHRFKSSKSLIPGSSLSGYMWSDTPSGSPSLSKAMSALVSDVAEGIATALYPADSIAQQSDGPSVIQSSSPDFNLLITGLLYIPTCEPRGKRKRGSPPPSPIYLPCTLSNLPSKSRYGISSDGAS